MRSDDSTEIPPIRIVISYRRDDTAGHAGHLHADLVRRFGEDQVFLDIENILPGLDFTEVIDDAIHGSDVVIALIGKEWLTATDRNGRRKLEKEDDFLRMELEAALTRNVRLIPVLVQDAEMPNAEDLPSTIRAFAKKNAFHLSDRRWRADVAELIQLLEQMARAKANEVTSHHDAQARERDRQAAARRDEERRADALRQAVIREELKEQAAHEQARRDQELHEELVREQLSREQAVREEARRKAAVPAPEPVHEHPVPTGGGGSLSQRPWLIGLAVAAVVVVVGAGLVALTAGGDGGTAATDGAERGTTVLTKTVSVRGDVPWNDTGIDVEAGQPLTITASGTVETARGDPGRNSDPAGKVGEEYLNNVVDGVRHGALIGMIGRGQPFEVGARYDKAAPGTGRLYLGVNDKGVENNSGEYTADITAG